MELKSEELVQSFSQNHFFYNDSPVFNESDFKAIQKYFFNFVERIPEPLRYLNCANHPEFRPAIADWVARDEILNVVKSLIGPNIVFWSIGICYKPPKSAYEVGWHIDSHCWMRDQVIFPPDALILFYSLTDMTEENGALELIQGLNTPKFYDHDQRPKDKFFFEYEIKEQELDTRKKTVITMKENQLCGFGSHVPHRSGPNNSDKPRLGITLRYLQSSVHITGTPLDGRDSYLISGIDLAGNKHAQLSARGSIGGLSNERKRA
ncbi:MAG: hypothetical protein K0R29_2672 [Pseudobdellovibrio sp.]|jgi:ectoine hydroxylase-related dioxygenase (phytanoyl-CoA dioxygenase family)|nr:hypothetical protein [Pseudobdellovibrio sp.]